MTQTTNTPNVEADTFNMFRLSAITGLTPRTIRYYIAKGLSAPSPTASVAAPTTTARTWSP